MNIQGEVTHRLALLAGILTLLDETEIELKTYALEQLDKLVYEFWAKVADGISKM